MKDYIIAGVLSMILIVFIVERIKNQEKRFTEIETNQAWLMKCKNQPIIQRVPIERSVLMQ